MTGNIDKDGLRLGEWMWSNLPSWLQEGKLIPLD
jgi:hypothetical protein